MYILLALFLYRTLLNRAPIVIESMFLRRIFSKTRHSEYGSFCLSQFKQKFLALLLSCCISYSWQIAVDPAPHLSSPPDLRCTKGLSPQQGLTYLSLLSLLSIQLTPLWLHNQLLDLDYLIFFFASISLWVNPESGCHINWKPQSSLIQNSNIAWFSSYTKNCSGHGFCCTIWKKTFAWDLAKIQNIFYIPIMWLQFYLKSSIL